jgi:hypothetical protein
MVPLLEKLLPLENGDRLTRSDFEQRYEAMPHVKKAELIEGIVYMPSPVRVRSHGKPHGQVMSWLGVYCAATPGVDFADNTTLRLDAANEPQPDAMLWIDAAAGARASAMMITWRAPRNWWWKLRRAALPMICTSSAKSTGAMVCKSILCGACMTGK